MSAYTRFESDFGDDVIVRDPAMLRIFETAATLARHKAAVLITGETGSGKDVVARLIHRFSTRSSRPWVDVNCAALPEHLVESELFGHERGAFSGADAAKPGLFEMANGGTLFLDEIGEIDPRVQVKLLRALDAVPFYRLGGTRKVACDVRLIAATNRNLEAAVQSGAFRRDLYHRITEFHIAVPPLRERPLDIAALASYFLAQLRPGQRMTAEAMELLTLRDWPGNVRELRNLMTKLSISVPGEMITADDLRRHTHERPTSHAGAAEPVPDRPATLNEMERLLIVRTLEAAGGNQSLAAQQLGVPRRTFCRKLNEYQITLGRRRTAAAGTSGTSTNGRSELFVPVSLTTSDGRVLAAESTDLSLGGMGLRGITESLGALEQITLSFSLPGQDSPILVRALVAWYRPEGTAGAQFARTTAPVRDRLQHWLSAALQSQPSLPADDFLPQLSA